MPVRSACMGAPLSIDNASRTRLTFTVIFVVAVAFSAESKPLRSSQKYIKGSPLIARDAAGRDFGPAVMLAIGHLRECSGDFTSALAHILENNTKASGTDSMTALVEVSCSLRLSDPQRCFDGHSSTNEQLEWMQISLKEQPLVVSGIHPLDCMMRSQAAYSRLFDVPYLFLLRSTGRSQQVQGLKLEAVDHVQLLDTVNTEWALPTEASQNRCQQIAASLGLVMQPCNPCMRTKCTDANHSGLRGTDGMQPTAPHARGPVRKPQRQLLQVNFTELVPSAVDTASDILRSVADRASTAADRLSSRAASAPGGGDVVAGAPPPPPSPSPPSPLPPPPPAPPLNASTGNTGATNQSSGQQQGVGVVQPDLVGSTAGAEVVNSSVTISPQTINSTQTINSAEARSTCALQPQAGPCRAMIPRWAFDLTTGACREFLYGGCDGNANNFASRQACEESCVAVSGDVLSAQKPIPTPAPPAGPVSTMVEESRVLTGGSTSGAVSSKGGERSFIEQLCRVAFAGAMAAMTVMLL